MAVQYTSASQRKTKALTTNTKDGLKSILSDMLTLEIMFVLKNYSSKAKPLSASEIMELLDYDKDEKRRLLNRKLAGLEHIFSLGEHYCDYFSIPMVSPGTEGEDACEDTRCYCNAALLRSFSSGIMQTITDPISNRKKYYFEPLLDDSCLDMIVNSLIANQYLADEERNYIINTLSTLNSVMKNHFPPLRPSVLADKHLTDLYDMIPRKLDIALSDDTSQLLKRMNLIYQAVICGYKIELIYGSYQKLDGKTLPALLPKKDKIHTLNPYALLTNDGHQYLIATYDGFDEPSHYRLDRIISVNLMKDNTKGSAGYCKRAPLPDTLTDFFNEHGFQKDLYTKAHPLMGIYKVSQPTTCILQCNSSGLGAVVDAFGLSNVHIRRASEDRNSYEVRVTAEYSSVRLFCIQQNSIVTAISPPELLGDIRDQLQKALLQYQDLLAKEAPDTP